MARALNLAAAAALLAATALTRSPPVEASVTTSNPSRPSQHMVISRAGALPSSKGPEATFTGSVVVTPLFAATEHTRASAASVSFEPCARSAWHTHPAGQTLVVTSGVGWIQEWGGTKREIRAGDVIWTPPGVKHWHGASATTPMTHMAIQEHVNGKVVDWLEQVTEEQYRAPGAGSEQP